jgi:drug/metabolite transporter (DMT)-like permease
MPSMTVSQLSIVATVLGVVAVILFVLGQSTLGVVVILLAGLAWTLTQYVRRSPGRRDDDRV